VKEPLVLPVGFNQEEIDKGIREGYEYVTLNWLHYGNFKKRGWETVGHTPGMDFVVMRKKK